MGMRLWLRICGAAAFRPDCASTAPSSTRTTTFEPMPRHRCPCGGTLDHRGPGTSNRGDAPSPSTFAPCTAPPANSTPRMRRVFLSARWVGDDAVLLPGANGRGSPPFTGLALGRRRIRSTRPIFSRRPIAKAQRSVSLVHFLSGRAPDGRSPVFLGQYPSPTAAMIAAASFRGRRKDTKGRPSASRAGPAFAPLTLCEGGRHLQRPMALTSRFQKIRRRNRPPPPIASRRATCSALPRRPRPGSSWNTNGVRHDAALQDGTRAWGPNGIVARAGHRQGCRPQGQDRCGFGARAPARISFLAWALKKNGPVALKGRELW